jgi:hypothetical protein
MRTFVAIVVAVIFYGTVSNALDSDPAAPPPYCWPLTNFTIANGTSLFDLYFDDEIANPIFINGQDVDDLGGYGIGHETWDWGLYGVQDWFGPAYNLPNGEPDSFSWGIIDGTADAVDIGLSFTAFVNGANISFTQGNLMCGEEQQTAMVEAQSFDDVAIEFQLYVPSGNASSWARVAIQLTNNGNSDAHVNAILVNNWGSDSYTVYKTIADHYSCSEEVRASSSLDPLLCYYWRSEDATPNFWWDNFSPKNASDNVFPAWNLTLSAGDSITLIHFLSQMSSHNWTELETEAAFINSNPIALYAYLPQGYQTGLLNFDQCSATGIVYPSMTMQSACTTAGGKASYTVGELDPSFAAVYPKIKVGNQTLDLAMSASTSVDIAAGTYDVTLIYGSCEHSLSPVTVTCPQPPTSSPTSSPSSSPSAPTSSKSSASSVRSTVFGLLVLLGSLVFV